MKLLETQQTVEFSSSLDNVKSSKEGVEIMPMDVLCGRGKNRYVKNNRSGIFKTPSSRTVNSLAPFLLLYSFNHVGNRKFRDIVAEAIPGYVTATSRATKSEIVTSIVRRVRESGGRFLKRDNDRKVWYVLNYTQSKEKAGHAIRDATITEDSKKQRAHKRKLMRAAASGTPPRKNVEPMVVHSHSVTKEAELNHQFLLKDLTSEVKSLDDESTPIECLSSMLMAHFPEKLFPDEMPSAAAFEPLPIDDPFNSYIDQLLGPLTELTDF